SSTNRKESRVRLPFRILLEIELHGKGIEFAQRLVHQLHHVIRSSRVPLPLPDSVAGDNDGEKRLLRTLKYRFQQILQLAHALGDIWRWHALIVRRLIRPANREQMREGFLPRE